MQRARSAECSSEEIAETGIALDDVTSDGPAAPPPRAPGRLLVCMLAFPRGDSGSASPLPLFPVDEGFMLSSVLSAGLCESARADWPVPWGSLGKDCRANCVFHGVAET